MTICDNTQCNNCNTSSPCSDLISGLRVSAHWLRLRISPGPAPALTPQIAAQSPSQISLAPVNDERKILDKTFKQKDIPDVLEVNSLTG